MSLLKRGAEKSAQAERWAAEDAEYEAKVEQAVKEADAAKGLGFRQDTPYVDGPMTCPECAALTMPKQAAEHLRWHSVQGQRIA